MFKKILGSIFFILGLFFVFTAYIAYTTLDAGGENYIIIFLALLSFFISWRFFTSSKRKIKKLNQNNFYVPSVNKSNLDEGPASTPIFDVTFSHSQSSNKASSDPEELELLNELGKTQLLYWCDMQSYPVASYPAYFSDRYFIKNAAEIHKGWIDSGILAPPKIDEILKYKTVVELKEILRKNKLKVSGKKSELIDRIIENNAFSVDFQNENNDPIYAITEAGRAILKNNKPWLYYHRMKNRDAIPLKFYKETWKHLQSIWQFVPSGLDISWACLQKLKLGVKSYRDLRSVLLASIEILEDSKKEEMIPDLALQIICIDLSGDVPFIAPYLINKVREIPKEELETRFYKAYDQIKVYEHFNVAGSLDAKNEIFKFILLGLDDIEKCNKELEKNYN